MPEPKIEALLAARLFLAPQLWNDRVYFLSNQSGRFSLYAMDAGGSVPEPLLPPDIALQNPELQAGYSFYVFPHLNKIVVSIDKDGDEAYQPQAIPIEGGFPEIMFPALAGSQVFFVPHPHDKNKLVLIAQSLTEPISRSYLADVTTGELEQVSESQWGGSPAAVNAANNRVVVEESYTGGDNILSLWERGQGQRPLYGTPLDERADGEEVAPNGIDSIHFTLDDKGLLFTTMLFDDAGGLGYLPLDGSGTIQPVGIEGIKHSGRGELEGLRWLHGARYGLYYNIDGVSWAYEGTFDEDAPTMRLDTVVCGQEPLAGGVMKAIHYDEGSDRYILAFSTAAGPAQLYLVSGADRKTVAAQTRERVLGIPPDWLARGEDASFTSFDGEQISARLYLPAPALGYDGSRPLVYYIHGGPQSQERPNFAWFSMPLIQFLTLNGFAVFVPNVRGSSGYGFRYVNMVHRDWGGQDRLDHVHAMTAVLPQDSRLDVTRTGVMGRSYGGYMTLTLTTRHPELWAAAVDMFGPYNLITSIERMPPTWHPFAHRTIGHPETEREKLLERSPATYIDNLACPMLVIQGANDPRVLEQESRELVEHLRGRGEEVDYLVFENEGHDVIKYENKVRCYNTITTFFKQHLKP